MNSEEESAWIIANSPRSRFILDTHNLAYLAGHFDGEGTIGIQPERRRIFLNVTHTHTPTLELYKSTFGGGVYFASKGVNKLVWQWTLSKRSAVAMALLALTPYLKEKSDKAERALSALNLMLTKT